MTRRAYPVGAMLDRTFVLQTVADHLGPVLGPTMARSSIDVHCRSLNIEGPRISPEQVSALLHKLSLGLAIFIGREKTASVLQRIETALKGTR